MSKSIVQEKSFLFAIDIVNLCKLLISDKKEYIMSKQLLKSGTSIGANVSEAVNGQSDKDFIAKLSISRKETQETLYWLKLLLATDYIDQQNADEMISKCNELYKILTSIIITMQQKTRNS